MSETSPISDPTERYRAGVLKYVQMGYWVPDYEPKDTDVLAVFRVTPWRPAARWTSRCS